MANPMLQTRRFGDLVQSGRYTLGIVDARSRTAVLTNLAGTGSAVQSQVKPQVQRTGRAVLGTALTEVPRRSGTLASAHRLSFSEGGLAFAVEVDPAVFAAKGLVYYANFVHNGTVKMAANPWLRRAYDAHAEAFKRDVVRRTQEALQRRSRVA